MTIPLFVPTFSKDEILAEISDCLDRGWTGMGYKTVEFEQAWKDYSGLPHAHFLNSASAGLHLAVHQLKRQFKWRDNDEIITTPLTFVSTNHVILYEDLLPVFADVDQYLCLDPQSVEDRITSHTRAIMFVGLGGNTGQMSAILDLCQRHDLKLILDASHMAGTLWYGEHVGHSADVSIFSFQAVKNLPTADSGMICWHDGEQDALSRQLSWLGIDKDTYSRTSAAGYSWQYDVPNLGWKYNGNSIMAAMGLVALRHLDADNARRRELCQVYDELLDSMERVPMAPDCVPSRHLYQILVDNRESVIEGLKRSGIGTGVHYRSNLNYPMYHGFCPRAEAYSERLLSLPLHLQMTSRDARFVAQKVMIETHA